MSSLMVQLPLVLEKVSVTACDISIAMAVTSRREVPTIATQFQKPIAMAVTSRRFQKTIAMPSQSNFQPDTDSHELSI